MKTIILICERDAGFHEVLNKVLREMHSHECEEGVSRSEVAEMFTCVINKLNTIIQKENKMADDFSALEKAQQDNSDAIDAAVTDIQKLVALIGATPPSNQPEIDRLTALFNTKTAALAAAAKSGDPIAPTTTT